MDKRIPVSSKVKECSANGLQITLEHGSLLDAFALAQLRGDSSAMKRIKEDIKDLIKEGKYLRKEGVAQAGSAHETTEQSSEHGRRLSKSKTSKQCVSIPNKMKENDELTEALTISELEVDIPSLLPHEVKTLLGTLVRQGDKQVVEGKLQEAEISYTEAYRLFVLFLEDCNRNMDAGLEFSAELLCRVVTVQLRMGKDFYADALRDCDGALRNTLTTSTKTKLAHVLHLWSLTLELQGEVAAAFVTAIWYSVVDVKVKWDTHKLERTRNTLQVALKKGNKKEASLILKELSAVGNNVVRQLVWLQDSENAEQVVKKVSTVFKEPKRSFYCAQSYSIMGQYEQAEEICQNVIRNNCNNREAMDLLENIWEAKSCKACKEKRMGKVEPVKVSTKGDKEGTFARVGEVKAATLENVGEDSSVFSKTQINDSKKIIDSPGNTECNTKDPTAMELDKLQPTKSEEFTSWQKTGAKPKTKMTKKQRQNAEWRKEQQIKRDIAEMMEKNEDKDKMKQMKEKIKNERQLGLGASQNVPEDDSELLTISKDHTERGDSVATSVSLPVDSSISCTTTGLPAKHLLSSSKKKAKKEQFEGNSSSSSNPNIDKKPFVDEVSLVPSLESSKVKTSITSPEIPCSNRYAPLTGNRPTSTAPVTSEKGVSHIRKKGRSEEWTLATKNDAESIASNGYLFSQKAAQSQTFPLDTSVQQQLLAHGISIVCEHFVKGSRKRGGTCNDCKSNGLTRYAFWEEERQKWKVIRPPGPNKMQYELCRHYSAGRSCIGDKCKFAHGIEELHFWNIVKEKGSALLQPCSALSEYPAANGKSVLLQRTSFGSKTRSCSNLSLAGVACTATKGGSASFASQLPSRIEIVAARGKERLPYGIVPVCMHFLSDHRLTERLCKGCENRGKGVYAFWSKESRAWTVIRSRPANVRNYSICTYVSSGRSCFLESNCKFAHSEQERFIWTTDNKKGLNSSIKPENMVEPSRTCNVAPDTNANQLQPRQSNQSTYRFREPPQGVKNGAFVMCKSFNEGLACRFGRGCLFAHGSEELQEWQSRWKKEQRPETGDKGVVGLITSTKTEIQFIDSLPEVQITCKPSQLSLALCDDKTGHHSHSWLFALVFKPKESGQLKTVALLHRYHQHYKMRKIVVGQYLSPRMTPDNYLRIDQRELKDDECIECSIEPVPHPQYMVLVQLKISFESAIYGSFAQTVMFDFGRRPVVLVQRLNVDVEGNQDILDELDHIRKDIAIQEEMWDNGALEIVGFEPDVCIAIDDEALGAHSYKLPQRPEVVVSAQVLKCKLDRSNYRRALHQLLFAEEFHMRKELSKFNLYKEKLHTQRVVFSQSRGMAQAEGDTMYGIIKVPFSVTPDDAVGRLVHRNVISLLLRMAYESGSSKVYEALIHSIEEENKCLVVKLPPAMVRECHLLENCDKDVDAQFRINRIPLREMHAAIDRLGPGHRQMLFPQPCNLPSAITTPLRWNCVVDQRLNDNQRKVISAIVHPESGYPLVVFGPFGTGKTFTLHQAVRQLVADKTNRVLVCTHSNRAADKHVELLDDYLLNKNGIRAAKPLRIYQPSRRIQTASETARKYCLIEDHSFVLPSRDDAIKHRVIVTALSTSQVLFKLSLNHGFFSHILIDEAAQALEPETITPIALAGPNTKIVLTGDHMQMSPEVYSKYARQWGLERSLPERLFDHYEAAKNESFKEAHVIFLTKNYRCHEEILKFPSDNFYGGTLLCEGQSNQLAHPTLGPLVFFTARGLERREEDHSYLNMAEVSEVTSRVVKLAEDWPEVWGPKDLKQIAVLAAYRLQVQAIRGALRKVRMKEVTVDTIHNVQGDEFRAVFISTVRTASTCKQLEDSMRTSGHDTKLYFEFLSDPKLLNTAMTRARSLVAVVGDPVSLCTVGECRALWKDYIKRCSDRGALYGTSVIQLAKDIRVSLNAAQLNPDAPAFVPMRTVAVQSDKRDHSKTQMNMTALSQHGNDFNSTSVAISNGETRYFGYSIILI